MKLSTYAKRTGICYMTAWKMFHANQIPGSYRLPTGTIIVPDSAIPDPKNPDDKKDLKVCHQPIRGQDGGPSQRPSCHHNFFLFQVIRTKEGEEKDRKDYQGTSRGN